MLQSLIINELKSGPRVGQFVLKDDVWIRLPFVVVVSKLLHYVHYLCVFYVLMNTKVLALPIIIGASLF